MDQADGYAVGNSGFTFDVAGIRLRRLRRPDWQAIAAIPRLTDEQRETPT